ncbi:MAG: hypothetical protein ACI4WV_03280 [Eubacteriales bacterium]
MKRLLAVMLSLLLVLSFVGCDKDKGEKNPIESGETVTDAADNTTAPGEETAPDTSETTETGAMNPPETEPETQPETDTQPEEILDPDEPSVDVSETLNTVLERLVTSGGISLTVDGKLSVVTTLFGMQVITDMPLSLSLITASNGLSAQAQIPMAGAYGLTVVDGVLYLSDEEGKYSCELPKAEDDGTVPALPAWGEEDQAMLLESVAELVEQLASVVQMKVDPLTGSVTATVSLCEGAAMLADELRAAMEEMETEADPEAGESISSEEDLANMALVLAWLETVAASPDAKLVFTAALDGEDAMVSVSISCPVDVSLLLSLLPEDEEGSALPADMSSTGDLSLTVTLRCGQMSVTAPEDAEDYTQTEWETIEAAIESALGSLLPDTDIPSEEFPVIGA